MQTSIKKNITEYLSMTQYLVCKGQLRGETAGAFEQFLQVATRDEMRLLMTTFTSNLELSLGDAVRRRGNWGIEYSTSAIDSARSFTSYSDYVKNMTESTINSSAAVAITAAFFDEKKYEVTYNLRDLETRYLVNGKEQTFEEILANMNEISLEARNPVRIVQPRMACSLVASIEGMTASDVELGDTDYKKVKGVDTVGMIGILQNGSLGLTSVELVNSMGAPDNNLKCKVGGVDINLEMKTNTYHRGVDVHEILPNGRVKVQVYNELGLDSTLDDRARRQYTERMLNRSDVKVGDCTYWNFSWIIIWQQENPNWSLKLLETWYPVMVPGSADLCLMKLKSPIQLWYNSTSMMTLVRMARRIHYIWCLLRAINEKISILKVVNIMILNMKMNYLAPIQVMFELFKRQYKVEVVVSQSQHSMSDVVAGYVARLKMSLEKDNAVFAEMLNDGDDMGGIVKEEEDKPIRMLEFDISHEDFLGRDDGRERKSIVSKLRGPTVLKDDGAIQLEMLHHMEAKKRFNDMPNQPSPHYINPTPVSKEFMHRPPDQVQLMNKLPLVSMKSDYDMKPTEKKISEVQHEEDKRKGYIQEGINVMDKVNNNFSPVFTGPPVVSDKDVQGMNEMFDGGINLEGF